MTTADTRNAFVPADLRATEWPSVEPLLRDLRERPADSPDAVRRWLVDRSELDAACSEAEANLYIAMTCRTDDDAANEAYRRFIEGVSPRLRSAAFELDRRHVALRAAVALGHDDDRRLLVLDRDTRSDVEIFREQNVPLQTELTTLAQRYEQICGAMTVVFDGEERTLPQMARYQEQPDRAVREAAWRAVAARRLRDRDEIDAIYDRMLDLRLRIARNAGADNYRDHAFREKRRFDYGPAACEAFHDACERLVAPLVRELDARRARDLGVDPLRPWDLAVDPRGRPALRPFEGAAELIDRTSRVFHRVDPRLGAMFDALREPGTLDLETRRGKAPGGYQYMRDRSRRPFIFMNAAGLQGDVRTMVHEAGHAFHSMLCRDEPLVHYRHSPIEFAEVASMSMELLTMEFWDEFYPDPEDHRRAVREQLEGVVSLLPWVAQVDAFQHWAHRMPGHTREERRTFWVGLGERFGHAASWSGLHAERASAWQRQPHLFGAPFYYIEYAIAQLGALRLWLIARREGLARAVDLYVHALSLGGGRPLPELFAAAGAPFDFGPAAVEDLVSMLRGELERASA